MIGPKAYIAKDKLERNIKNIRTYIGPKKLMIVVKANGYGHGLLNVASILSSQEDIILCVFNIQEAILLRENGIRNNILIFSRIQQDWVIRAFELNLWVNICHWDDLLLVDRIISETGLCPKIHLKFDTGMTRLGFDITDSEKVFNQQIFYGKQNIANKKLTIPHPRAHLRDFVLRPISDIDSNFIHPTKKISIRNMISQLDENFIFKKLSNRNLR